MTQERLPAELALVALGGAAGAAARWALALAWPTSPGGFPAATLTVNLLGSAAAGVLAVVLDRAAAPWRPARPLLGTGLLGGFTTYSTFALELRDLASSGRVGLGMAYGGSTVLGGLLVAGAAMALTRRCWPTPGSTGCAQ